MPSRWAPIESNPEVLSEWATAVGLPNELVEFSEVYGLDPDLLNLVPKPVEAVLLVFPITKEFDKIRNSEDERLQKDGQPHLDPTLFYVKQTIPNACGTIALLHSIYNSPLPVEPMSALQKFQDEGIAMTPEQRAKLLEETDLFATAHEAAAAGGQSAMPANLDTDYHFIAFVQAPDAQDPEKHRIVELDGRRSGPVDLGESEELLAGAARVIQEKYMGTLKSIGFSMIAICQPDLGNPQTKTPNQG